MEAEYRLVIDANGITEEESYRTTVRTGRPRWTRPERRAAWPFLLAFQRILKKRNLLTFEGAIHQARLAVEHGHFTRYAHVLVDEIQDFGLEALRLIRALSPIDAGTPAPSPVRTALASAGIPIYPLLRNEEDPGSSQPGIRLGTMKRIKGLEFRAVAMACADENDALNRQDATQAERCERYVAATRAREYLLITPGQTV